MLMQRVCRCPIKPGMDYDALRYVARYQNCCDPDYMCPTLDRWLQRARLDYDRKMQYSKRMALKNG